MNAQEMCNVVNLMLHKDVDIDPCFKDAYAKQLQALINTVKPSLLDALTITQSISCWDIAPNIDMESLDKVLQNAVNNTNVQFGPKHVYLLHYCHNLKCAKTSRTLAYMVKRDLLDSLTNKELVVLHNALHNIGAEEKVVLNSVLEQRLKAVQCFSEIDLQTIVHWGNPKLCELVAQNYIGTQKRHSARSIRILATLLKMNTNHELTDAAIKQIELLKGTSTINIDNVVACCELLPYLQNEVDIMSIYNHAIQNVCSRIHDTQVDPKLVVTMLSIARKLNITSKELGILANSITNEKLDPPAFLEYLNAVYHLELQVIDERRLLYQAERAINNTANTRIKDSIVLTLAYLAFMGNLQYEVVQPLIAKQLNPGSSYMAIKAAYVSILGRTTGVLPPIFGRQKREHLAQPDTKLHTGIQATIAKVIGKTALNEVTVALDYVTEY
uniref:Uncharacterized protein n=1 Tax=Babesia bovis TaxID=5865 RepID=S6C8L7_BABBO|nr:hypothetical protein [Babesia bovis]